MKKIVYIFLITLFYSCDNYLDIVPDNIATIDYAFRNRAGAESYLSTCYWYMPYFGDPRYDPAIMGGDDIWSLVDEYNRDRAGNYAAFNIKLQQNTNEPYVNCWTGGNQGRDLFEGIRCCNIFLENIEKVGPDLSSVERNRMIAEVKFLKAYYHYYLLRMYGPIPLIKENLPVDAPNSEVRLYRNTFDDCVDYIVQLIDEAVVDLPQIIYDLTNELGRITQLIALSVKAEILVTAASPLFNNNPDYAAFTDKRGINLFQSTLTEAEKWESAKNACSEAINLANELKENFFLYNFRQSPYYSSYSGISDTSELVMTLRTVVMDKWNNEIIWGYSNSTTSTAYQRLSLPYFIAGHAGLAATEPIISPTMRMVELFYSNNGVPIEEDNSYDYAGRFNLVQAQSDHKYYVQPNYETAKIHLNREPRFYANIGFDGGYWLGNGRKKDPGQLPSDQQAWTLDLKKGSPSGNYRGVSYPITGYLQKKGSHYESAVNSSSSSLTNVTTGFPIMRLADLYLLYAEALNETLASPSDEVYQYIDLVRFRAGLKGVVESWRNYSSSPEKPSSKEGLRDIIRQERMIELAFEGKRFWDIRRWKTAETLMNEPVRGWNIMGETTEDFYSMINLHSLQFGKKEYLWPIRIEELRRNTNLVQTPGW